MLHVSNRVVDIASDRIFLGDPNVRSPRQIHYPPQQPNYLQLQPQYYLDFLT